MRKKLRRGPLLAALAALLLLAGCGGEDEPEIEPTPHVHVWEDGVCTDCGEVCAHRWEDGVCAVCGKVCEHEWEDGVCAVCGMPCPHEWVESVCTICGKVCEHEWEDGVCAVCGKVCEHEWVDGVCPKCGMPCPHPQHDPETLICPDCGQRAPHEYFGGVCTRCGAEPVFITRMLDLPIKFKDTTDEKGTIEYYHFALEGGEVLPGKRGADTIEERRMRDVVVYLPYGYDGSKPCDLLIVSPGAGHNAHQWMEWTNLVSTVAGRLKGRDFLDRLIAAEKIEPVIVVVVEYYLQGTPAEVAVKYERDLRERVLPFLAQTYRTYASADESGALIPAPEHCGYIGFSFGSMIGWQMLPDCTDVFGYWGLISGAFQNDEEIVERINAGVSEENPILYLYAGDGMVALGRVAYENRIEKLSRYCAGLEKGVNMSFLAIQRAEHSYSAWDAGLYNSLQVFFHSRYDPEELPPAEPLPTPIIG